MRAGYTITTRAAPQSSSTVRRDVKPDGDNQDSSDFIFVETVSGNKVGFTKRAIKGAETARTLYSTLSFPSWNDYKWMIRSNQIKDCPVTVADVDIAYQIWGKNIAALKGKTTRRKPAPVATDYVKIPKEFLNLHGDVFLTLDIFFVNKIPFLLTLSRKICYTTVQHLAGRTVSQIFQSFKEVYQHYLRRGFRVTTVHADGEFSPLKPLIESMPSGPVVNLASSNEHVPEIERRIRVVKERSRATRHNLPFTRIPKLLMIHLVINAVKLLNYFPTKGGVSETLSPKTILTGETLDYKKHLRLQIGQYCQVHEEDTPRNSQRPRTKGAICLGPSGNLQGGYHFMALSTGQKIIRRSWDAIPMPDTVIARVNALGADQPEELTFTDRHGRLIGDNEIPGVTFDPDHFPDGEAVPPSVATLNPLAEPLQFEDADFAEPPNPVEALPAADHDAHVPEMDDAAFPGADDSDEIPGVAEDVFHAPEPVEPVLDATAAPPVFDTEAVAPAPAAPPAVTHEARRSTRIRTQPTAYVPSMSGSRYAYAVTQLAEENVMHPDAHMFLQDDFYQSEPDVVAAIMTQLSLKRGLQEWGDDAYLAAEAEMKQLHFRNTFKPKHWKDLSATQRQTILESHMFLKEKRDGSIKGRTVAGGNKQRDYISKEDASSPTVATESVLLTCIIDAEEERDVAVIDIPNAFIQTRIEDEKDMATIKLRGVLVDILVAISARRVQAVRNKGQKGCEPAYCAVPECAVRHYDRQPPVLPQVH